MTDRKGSPLDNKESKKEGWRDGSAINITCCSYKSPGFNSKHPCEGLRITCDSSSWLSNTYGTFGYLYIYKSIHRPHTLLNIVKINLIKEKQTPNMTQAQLLPHPPGLRQKPGRLKQRSGEALFSCWESSCPDKLNVCLWGRC